MREILATLYPYIILLYLFDCLVYVGRHQVFFISLCGKGFRRVKSGIHLSGLFPFSETFVACSLNLFSSESGIYLRSNDNESQGLLNYPEEYLFIPYADIENPVAEGNMLILNKSVSVKTPSVLCAKRLAGRLVDAARTEYSKRSDLILKLMKKDTDMDRIRQIHQSCKQRFGCLKILCTLLFIEFFLLLPISLYWILPSEFVLYILIANIAILYFCTVIYTYYLLGKVYGKNSGLNTTVMLSITLSPVAAIHALSYLTKDLFSLFDPIALAAYLLPGEKFHSFMRREIYRIHTACRENDDFGWAEFWQSRLIAVKELLKKLDLKEKDIIAPPGKTEASASSYCPVCQTEYRPGFGFCSDCGVVLMAYA